MNLGSQPNCIDGYSYLKIGRNCNLCFDHSYVIIDTDADKELRVKT